MSLEYDYLLCGGGLQNGLIALSLLSSRPESRIALIEREASLGGNHLWSFHAGDIPKEAEAFVAPLVVHRWPGYWVNFPTLERFIQEPYASITSARLSEVVSARLKETPGCALFTRTNVQTITAHTVTLPEGQTLHGKVVIDARGPSSFIRRARVGYQKFFGMELTIPEGSGPRWPVLMDASVPQKDGFRFFYLLPLAPDRLLVEDTYFSDTAALDLEDTRREIFSYLLRWGVRPGAIVREETGVLPLPTSAPELSQDGPLLAGYQGGWFHPTTGYSLPVAVRLASFIARQEPDALFGAGFQSLVKRHRRQLRFCLFLNKLLFGAYAPKDRRNVLERFYRLPVETIRHFYALDLSSLDRLRIVWGAPPEGLSMRALPGLFWQEAWA